MDGIHQPPLRGLGLGRAGEQVGGEQDVGEIVAQVVRDQLGPFLVFLREATQRVAGALQGGMGAHPGQQFLGHERLGDVIDGAGGESADQVLAVVVGGQEDHRQVAQRRVLAHLPQHLETVHARHAHVQQHQVRPVRTRQLEPLLATARGHALEAGTAEQRTDHLHVVGLVVHHQDPCLGGGGAGGRLDHDLRRHRPCASGRGWNCRCRACARRLPASGTWPARSVCACARVPRANTARPAPRRAKHRPGG